MRGEAERDVEVRALVPLRLAAAAGLACILVLAGLGDAVRHGHEGPVVETVDCVVDHERHEGAQHSTPVDEPHVETDAEEHEHGCVACHGSRIRVAVAASVGFSQLPVFTGRTLIENGRASDARTHRLPSPRGPPPAQSS